MLDFLSTCFFKDILAVATKPLVKWSILPLALAVLLELNAAFDTTDHNILLDKIENIVEVMEQHFPGSGLICLYMLVLLYAFLGCVLCSTRIYFRPTGFIIIYCTSWNSYSDTHQFNKSEKCMKTFDCGCFLASS